MIILLVRHGQTDWNINTLIQGRINNVLNEKGEGQARTVGEYLKENDPSWDVVISSPLARAYETAEIVTNILELDKVIATDDDLMERDFGNMEGLSLNDETYKILENNLNDTVETYESLQMRVVSSLRRISNSNPGKRVIVFAHAQVIKAAIAKFDPSFDFKTLLYNSSMNYFEANGDDIKVLKYNVVPEGHEQF